MQIVEKRDTIFGKRSYELAVPEVQTEKEFYGLAYDIAGIENVNRIECQGYSDMDTHENFITFKSRDEFKKNLADVKKIKADSITVYYRNYSLINFFKASIFTGSSYDVVSVAFLNLTASKLKILS